MENTKRKRMIAPIGAVVVTLLLALACMMIGMETWQAHAESDVTSQSETEYTWASKPYAWPTGANMWTNKGKLLDKQGGAHDVEINDSNDLYTPVNTVDDMYVLYTVTLKVDYDTSGSSMQRYKIQIPISTTIAEEYTGFWLDISTSGIREQDCSYEIADGSLTIYAVTTFNYFANYNGSTFVNGATAKPMRIVCKKAYRLPADPVKEGHTFVGWFYGTDTAPHDSCEAYDSNIEITEDTELHAHFAINTYVVTYNAAGGSAADPATVNWYSTAPLRTTSRTGYNFMGWYNGETKYTDQPITENVTLTAKWEIKMLTVTFSADGSMISTISVPYGTKLSEAMASASVAAYHAYTIEGVRMSKLSTVTEDTAVEVKKLTKYEKFGDYVGQHTWVIWTTVGLIGVLALTCGICITILVKRR